VFFLLFVSLVPTDVHSSSFYAPQSSEATPSEATSHILMTVSDNTGNSASAPLRESVQLQIGGQPVEVGEIRSLKDSPLFFSVLVDVSGSSKQFADQQIAATTKLFRDLSVGENHGYLVLFKDKVASNDQVLSAAQVEEILKHFPAQSRWGGTSLHDALIHAATVQLASTKLPGDSRRAIFVLSDFEDDTSRSSLSATLKVLQEQSTPVIAIGFHSSSSAKGVKIELTTVKALTNATGGWGTFLDEPGDVVGRAAGLTNGQCLVLFKPPALKPNKSYPMRIESSNKDIHIMAPKEFVVP